MSTIKDVAHTPGPWTSEGHGMHVCAGSMMVCDIRGWGHLTGKGGGRGLDEDTAIAIQEANARLIAAAPELLAAAKLTALHFARNQASGTDQDDDEHEAWTALRAALAKAEILVCVEWAV